MLTSNTSQVGKFLGKMLSLNIEHIKLHLKKKKKSIGKRYIRWKEKQQKASNKFAGFGQCRFMERQDSLGAMTVAGL